MCAEDFNATEDVLDLVNAISQLLRTSFHHSLLYISNQNYKKPGSKSKIMSSACR